jgi:anti-sigma-K factor RskA
MSAHSTRYEELLPAFALGAADGEERRELEQHLAAGCAECERLLVVWQGDLEELAIAVAPVTPPAGARGNLLAEIAREAKATGPAAPGASSAGPAAAAATAPPAAIPSGAAAPAVGSAGSAAAAADPNAASTRPGPAAAPLPHEAGPPAVGRISRWLLPIAALLAIALWGVIRQASLTEEVRRLSSELQGVRRQADALGRQLAEVRGENLRMARALEIIAAPGVQTVSLRGLGPAPRAAGHTYVNPEARKALFYAYGLPPLPPGKTYELWFIDPTGPVPAGVFAADPRGMASLEVDNVAPTQRILAWAVTVEPRGGVPKPTGAMVLKG